MAPGLDCRVVDHPEYGRAPKFILGGGSNVVLTRDVAAVVLKVEVMGRRAMGFSFLDADGKGWHAPIIDGTRMPCAPEDRRSVAGTSQPSSSPLWPL